MSIPGRNEQQPQPASWWARCAWLPIPLLATAMVAIWVTDARAVWHLPPVFRLLAYGPAALAVGFIVIPAALSFLANRSHSVLMLGCGMWVSSLGVVGGALGASRSLDQNWAIYNTAYLISALCHLAGVATSSKDWKARHAAAWLAAAYGGGLAAVGLAGWGAFTGRMPAFHIAGQGGTPLHDLVVGLTVACFSVTAGMLWQTHRRLPAPFLYWYGLGLGLLAAGLAGSMLIAGPDSPLQWTTRSARALGTLYLCVAMLFQRRSNGRESTLAALGQTWRERGPLARLGRNTLLGWGLRYGSAVAVVAAAFLLRLGFAGWFGPGMPPYILFYPAVMAVALVAGFGPGLLATACAGMVVEYWVLEPVGQFAVANPMDRLGLVIFMGMGGAVSLLAERYRRIQAKAARYEREAAVQSVRDQTEEQLRELSQRLSYHVDHSPLAVIEWGPDMRLTRWSLEAERIFGWRAEEVLGKRMEDFRWIYPEDEAKVEQVSGELRSGANPGRCSTNRNYRKDGSVVHCEWYNSSLLDGQGSLRSILSLVLDVTERKQMEATLREEARRKDDFLALLGHELRNPLAPIGNAVHLLRIAGPDPELSDRVCTIIQRQVGHLSRLVDDLLDVSRIRRGRIDLKLEVFDLGAAVRGVLADYQPVLQENGHSLEAVLPTEPIRIEADRTRIVQAVSNLVHNANKFTDPGGRIAVTVGLDRPGWGFVRVQDSGLGIRPELLRSIFEPFMQGKDTIGRSRGGLGLGLALVKGMADLHGGRVEAWSGGPGLGSTFTILLPVLQTTVPASVPASQARESFLPRRILVVEDHADSALTLRLLLEALGHQVALARDGRAGLDLARSFAPEIILCDIGLPGEFSGHDVARIIRGTAGLRDIHLVALSGFGTPEDKERAIQAGFDSHLTKPVDPAMLGPWLAAIPSGAGAS
jgi:PAS domain S-box-containing protein